MDGTDSESCTLVGIYCQSLELVVAIPPLPPSAFMGQLYFSEISGSHSGKYEVYSLLARSTAWSD
jgi:hypothetical protein